MSSFFDMLTTLIALLIAAAFLHFGGAEATAGRDSTLQPSAAPVSAASKPALHNADDNG